MSSRWGATPAQWTHLDLMEGLTADLLPVVSNPNATISPNSRMKSLGKTPSLYNGSGLVAGFKDWTSHEGTSEEIARWSQQPDYGICLQTRHVRAVDIDILDASIAADIERRLVDALGALPLRRRENSTKRLAFFYVQGEYSKRVMHIGDGIVEFLATG